MQQFFQQFINQQGNQMTSNPVLDHNNMVLEIANNWGFVCQTLYGYKQGILKKVDVLQQDWLNFIYKNNIDIEFFGKDPESFMKAHIKPLT